MDIAHPRRDTSVWQPTLHGIVLHRLHISAGLSVLHVPDVAASSEAGGGRR